MAERLLTDREFREGIETLLNGPASAGYALRVTIKSVDNDSEVALYQSVHVPAVEPNETRDLTGEESAVRCRCDVWRVGQGSRANLNDLISRLESLVDHWRSRDPKTMLPNLSHPGTPERFVRFAQAAASAPIVAVLHTDLDHFKKVNDALGEPGGDRVLREFSDRFRKAFSQMGVVVRTGGEEFSAILQADSFGQLLRAVEEFRLQMETQHFEALGRSNTCSIGLSVYPDGERVSDATGKDEILSDARTAEVRAKSEGRNRIALVGPRPEEIQARTTSREDLVMAALRARSLVPSEKAGVAGELVAAIVEAIEEKLKGGSLDALPTAVAETKDTFGLLIGEYSSADGRPPATLGIISSLDWASCVARAALKSTFDYQSPLKPTDRLALEVDGTGALSLAIEGFASVPLYCNVVVEQALRAEIGRPVYRDDGVPDGGVARQFDGDLDATGHDPLSPVLLMPIGDDAKTIAEELRPVVAGIVGIDDRPVRGGGLPDFWQSNLSRVIRLCLANPNISRIVAMGDASTARHTIERLDKSGAGSLDIPELQHWLSMPPERLQAFADRGISVETVAAARPAVVEAVSAAVADLQALDFSTRIAFDPSKERVRRRLKIPAPDQSHRLVITDGLRVATLADAYPEAVQLIRSASNTADYDEGTRGSFRELSGFKIVLTNPLQEMTPDYWSQDQTLLDEYYRDNFTGTAGLFGNRLNRPFKDGEVSMLDFAVAQTADALIQRLPTRRINLPIVPEALEQPLGLSTIQVMPRCRSNEQKLDLLWVWRTVDALVGFPFSAYGSICGSRDFLELVKAELSNRGEKSSVALGELTYIALSFHMYLHDGDFEIARTIVQDASR